MSNTDIYKSMLKSFVQDNFDLFQNAKTYDKNTESSDVFKYIPNSYDKDDPEFIGNSEFVSNLVEQFKYTFIKSSDIVFDIKGHQEISDNTKLSDWLETSNSYLIKEFNYNLKFKIIIDLFSTYIHLLNNTDDLKFTSLFPFGKDNIELITSCNCSKCGTYFSAFINFESSKVEIVNKNSKECDFNKKTPSSIKVNLKAPSKKLVFLNNPRKFLNIKREDKYECSINSLLGVIKETEFYAEHNVGFFFVGNTGLHAFKKGNKILFANYDEESLTHQKKYADYTNYGYVCMDLWWYTVLDFDLYNKLCSENNVNPNDIDHIVVDIDGTDVSISHSHKAHTNGYNYGVHSKITIK